MRSVGVVTVGRSDYGLWRPILRRIRSCPDLRLLLFASGSHLREIADDGFPIAERVRLPAGDSPQAIARAMGEAVKGFAAAFARRRPGLLLVLGDRFEMHAAALAALPFNIPLAHVHGGELTAGAFDDALRHSLTKLSHLHFVAAPAYARRVRQLGEEPWRITVSGAPALDDLRDWTPCPRAELERELRLDLSTAPLLVTFHPVTLEYGRAAYQIGELLAAVKASGRPAVFTMPNADTENRVIRARIRDFVSREPSARAFESLGTRRYRSLMGLTAAMVGNSSSGIIEAPSFRLPVVNVGARQDGRLRARNVIDTGYARGEVLAGIRRALRPDFRRGLKGLRSPFGAGRAAQVIVARIRALRWEGLTSKRFADLGGSNP